MFKFISRSIIKLLCYLIFCHFTMIKIYIIADSFKHFQSAIDEYTKRLGKKLEIIKIKPSKNGAPSQIIEKDTQNIKKYLDKSDSFNILLSLE